MRVCLPYQELWTVPTRSPQINVAGQFSSQPSDILFIEIVWVSCYYLLRRFYLSYSLCCAQICDVAQIASSASDPMLKVGWDWHGGDRSVGDRSGYVGTWTPEDCGWDPWPGTIDGDAP